MATLKLQSPWVSYINKIREFFKRDPDIKMTWSDKTHDLKIYVSKQEKAEAISKLLPAEKVFGKIIVKIYIISIEEIPKTITDSVDPATINAAFSGNPIFNYTKTFDVFIGQPVTYVVFAKEVLQWFNDDLNDLFGNANMLAEDIAREIFAEVDTKGIMFCTDIE